MGAGLLLPPPQAPVDEERQERAQAQYPMGAADEIAHIVIARVIIKQIAARA
jgi:hypothetical protein